ncbi:hypothetical protein [Micromonospora sp. NPDC047730]|uniref:hypothetical protein n=1 Tax=unclassified Micromonospora TaxID=2617518 RepID=UPI00371C2014
MPDDLDGQRYSKRRKHQDPCEYVSGDAGRAGQQAVYAYCAEDHGYTEVRGSTQLCVTDLPTTPLDH